MVALVDDRPLERAEPGPGLQRSPSPRGAAVGACCATLAVQRPGQPAAQLAAAGAVLGATAPADPVLGALSAKPV